MRYLLLALITLGLMSSCREKPVKRLMVIKGKLLKFKQLNYPSGSTLILNQNKLYLMGDDATGLLAMDTAFHEIGAFPLFLSSKFERIEKPVKADIEAGDFLSEDENIYLFSSGSVDNYRDSLFKFRITDKHVSRIDLSVLYSRLKRTDVKELNIEAASFINGQILLGNRGNVKNSQNYLVSINNNFAESQLNTGLKLIKVVPEVASAGLSGMAYDPVKDILFITFSTEDTKNSYQDGKVGESYLALIDKISEKLNREVLYIDAWLPLSFIDVSFEKMKIESVATEGFKDNKYTLFLVADNDNGNTSLFKVLLSF